MSTSDFKEINNRDAWSSIRGFVYQVDHTILRWLRLQQDEALELERGEDLDYISKLYGEPESRTLEQFKHREAKISLNQQLILEVLRNFYLHKINNPEIKLKFRFVTNTDYTLERPALFENGEKGIDVWKKLHKQGFISESHNGYKAIKKRLLSNIIERINPDEKAAENIKKNNALWQSFEEYVRNDENLIGIILDFEWSTQSHSVDSISADIIKELEDTYVSKPGKILYERLFLYVFKLLCSSEVKRLQKEQLDVQSTLPELSGEDKTLFDFLKDAVNNIHDRINKLEVESSVSSQQIDTLYQHVDQLKSNATFDLHLRTIDTLPPPLIERGTLRTQKVKNIMVLFESVSWVALRGLNGSGKTQLGSLVCRQFQNSFWLDLREFVADTVRAALAIEAFVTNLTGEVCGTNRQLWAKQSLEKLPSNSLIVFNDIPEISTDDIALNRILAAVQLALADSNVKLLSTSNHPLPFDIRNGSLTPICDFDNFEFSNEEIQECLMNYGADESIKKFIRLIAIRSKRHPRLVLAIINHLKDKDWGRDMDLYAIAFDRDFSQSVIADAQRSITRHIPRKETKELLYRMSLINWSMTVPEIMAICEVEEKVFHPNEHLEALCNIWIQKVSDMMFQVSPIVNNLGELNLTDRVVKNVHAAYADAIVGHSKITIDSAMKPISSYVLGGKFNNAGQILFNLYRSASKKEEAEVLSKWGYLFYWNEMPIPDEMDSTLRVFIKIEQLRLTKLLSKDTKQIFEVIHGYLDNFDLPKEDSLVVRALLLARHPDMGLLYYWKYLRFLVNEFPLLTSREKIPVDSSFLSVLFWIPSRMMVSIGDFKSWLELARLFRYNFGSSVSDHEIATIGVEMLCSRIVSVNPQNLATPEFAASQLERLGLLRNFFHEEKHETLEAIVIREIINVGLILTNDIEELIVKVKSELSSLKRTESLFLMTAYLGRVLIRNNRKEEANYWLEIALAYDMKDHHEYVETLLNASSIAAKKSTALSVTYCLNAVQLARSRKVFVETEYLQCLGELGVAYWLNGEPRAVFEIYEELVSELYRIREIGFTGDSLRIFQLTGHATGYVLSMMTEGIPPQTGGKSYFEPFVGMFTRYYPDLSSIHDPKIDSLLAGQLAHLADALDLPGKAYKWSLLAFDCARQSKQAKALHMIATTCGRYAVIEFKPVEAFEAYLTSCAVAAHLEGNPISKYNFDDPGNLEGLLTERPSEKWNIAEGNTLQFAVIPLFVKVLNAYLGDFSFRKMFGEDLLTTIRNYRQEASDTLLWDLVDEIVLEVIERRTQPAMLIDRAKVFGEQGKKGLQLLCLVGVVFLSDNSSKELMQTLLSFAPYLQKLNGKISSINKFVMLPFVIFLSERVVRKEFVGSQSELNEKLSLLREMNIADPHAIQKVIQIAFELLDITIPNDKKRWLYEFVEI